VAREKKQTTPQFHNCRWTGWVKPAYYVPLCS
jgi:hypothetical protein